MALPEVAAAEPPVAESSELATQAEAAEPSAGPESGAATETEVTAPLAPDPSAESNSQSVTAPPAASGNSTQAVSADETAATTAEVDKEPTTAVADLTMPETAAETSLAEPTRQEEASDPPDTAPAESTIPEAGAGTAEAAAEATVAKSTMPEVGQETAEAAPAEPTLPEAAEEAEADSMMPEAAAEPAPAESTMREATDQPEFGAPSSPSGVASSAAPSTPNNGGSGEPKPTKAEQRAKQTAPSRGAPSPSQKLQRAGSAPPARGYQVAQAYKHSIDLPPRWSIRPKTNFGSPFKSSKQADEGGMAPDMSSKYNEIRPRAPAYSMIPRSSGITKTSDQPGPGEYAQPSTLYGSHPQLPVPGRICKSTQRRTGPTDQLGEMKNNPSPHDYDTMCSGPDKGHKFGRVDQASAPKFTMRPKVAFGSQFKSAKQAEEGGMSGDMSSKYNEIRPRAPAYSMIPRSSGITKTSDQPGPGEYAQPSTLYGSHPQLPVPGRICKSTQRRTGPTDQLGEMKNNPSPHDYDTMCSGPDKGHKFGRVDQASAPKFTMRPKVAFGSQFKSAKQAEEGGMSGDMSSKYNEIRPRAPAYSMIPRSSGITKTSDQPGPGEYAQPSTLYGSHPQLPVPGRICKSTQRRTGPTDQLGEMKNNPSPHDYDTTCSGPDKGHKFGRVDQASAPKFTMRPKVAFGSQFKSAKQAEEGGMSGDMSSKYNEIRPRAPSYSMIPRSSGITKTSDQPGPGQYLLPSTWLGGSQQLEVGR